MEQNRLKELGRKQIGMVLLKLSLVKSRHRYRDSPKKLVEPSLLELFGHSIVASPKRVFFFFFKFELTAGFVKGKTTVIKSLKEKLSLN